MKVVVVGAGVVGLCTALTLRREGAEVTVLDRASVDRGASAANAGWVVPVLSAPLSGPGALMGAAQATLRGEGSVRVRPAAGLLGWAAGFLRSTRTDRHRDGLRAMLALGARSVELFDELRASGVEFEMHRRGLLIAARTRRGLESAEALVTSAHAAGYAGQTRVHTGPAVRELEPALSDAVVGVVHAVAEAHVRPESLLAGVRAALIEEGATLRRGVAVRGVEPDGTGWTVGTTSGPVTGDRVVIDRKSVV